MFFSFAHKTPFLSSKRRANSAAAIVAVIIIFNNVVAPNVEPIATAYFKSPPPIHPLIYGKINKRNPSAAPVRENNNPCKIEPYTIVCQIIPPIINGKVTTFGIVRYFISVYIM